MVHLNQAGPLGSFSPARYATGLALASVGTVLAVYISPTSLGTYHWAVLLLAFAMFIGFSMYLALHNPMRLRAFLRGYFTALLVTIAAPMLFSGVTEVLLEVGVIGRVLQMLPVLAAFVAIVKTYLMGAAPDMVVEKWSDMQ